MSWIFNILSLKLLFLLICFCNQSLAFVNVESIRQVGGEGFFGKTGLQLSGQQGNTNKFTSQFSTVHLLRDDTNEWLLTGNYKYGESSFLKDTNQGSAHLRHTWSYQADLAYEAFFQSGFDEFKDLNSRNYLGGNLRWKVAQDDLSRFYFGIGAFYEIEDFSNDRDEEGFRGNFYLTCSRKVSEFISGSSIIYFQPKLREMQNYRLRLQAGLDLRITDSWILDIDFNVVHDTGLPPEIKQTDIDYMVGFSVTY